MDLKPAVLSILVGVNDIWHKLAGRYDGTRRGLRDRLPSAARANARRAAGRADRGLRAVRAAVRGGQRRVVSRVRPAAGGGQASWPTR